MSKKLSLQANTENQREFIQHCFEFKLLQTFISDQDVHHQHTLSYYSKNKEAINNNNNEGRLLRFYQSNNFNV